MPVINVLYLPRDDRLRMIVRIAIDFVEEVYRDDVISGLRFVVFDDTDSFDVEQVKYIAVKEGFAGEVEHRGCTYKPRLPRFSWPHYDYDRRYAWVPVLKYSKIPRIFGSVVHEVTHHVVGGLPREDVNAIINALRADLGADVEEALVRYARYASLSGKVPKWVSYLRDVIEEITVTYISRNYFANLEREPRTPTLLTGIRDFATLVHFATPSHPPIYRTLGKLYYKMAHQDLASFRRAVHGAFAKTIKRFPADVLESNRIKYEILYREEPIAHLQ
jgi:hypothetical protein